MKKAVDEILEKEPKERISKQSIYNLKIKTPLKNPESIALMKELNSLTGLYNKKEEFFDMAKITEKQYSDLLAGKTILNEKTLNKINKALRYKITGEILDQDSKVPNEKLLGDLAKLRDITLPFFQNVKRTVVRGGR